MKKAYKISGLLILAIVIIGSTIYLARTPRYVRSGGDQPIVHDNVTNLDWQGCVAERTGYDCDGGTTVAKDWDGGFSYCATLNWNGQSGWRLPDIKELSSLVETRKYNPAIDTTAFPVTPSESFWSSSSNAGYNVHGWYVDFKHGYLSNYLKTNSSIVRCVR